MGPIFLRQTLKGFSRRAAYRNKFDIRLLFSVRSTWSYVCVALVRDELTPYIICILGKKSICWLDRQWDFEGKR